MKVLPLFPSLLMLSASLQLLRPIYPKDREDISQKTYLALMVFLLQILTKVAKPTDFSSTSPTSHSSKLTSAISSFLGLHFFLKNGSINLG